MRTLSPAEREAFNKTLVRMDKDCTYEQFCASFLAELEKDAEPVAQYLDESDCEFVYIGAIEIPRGALLYLRPTIPADMVLVPREPTEEMIDAVLDERMNALATGTEHTFIDIYRAMISASEVKK